MDAPRNASQVARGRIAAGIAAGGRDIASIASEPRELFGHPRGLTVLATTEMWERFSFYGMQALLMLYMVKYLLLPENARNVLGLAAYRHGLEAVVGKLSDLAFAGQTYGLYSGMIYLTPILGAWLGDRVPRIGVR